MKQDIVRGAHVIFCDDIRQEITGHQTMVGVYGNQISTSKFPAIIPQLVIHVIIWCDLDDLFQECKFVVSFDDKAFFTYEVPLKESLDANELKLIENGAHKGPQNRLLIKVDHRIVPFLIEKPGVLRVRVETEREFIRAGSITISSDKPPVAVEEIPLVDSKTL